MLQKNGIHWKGYSLDSMSYKNASCVQQAQSTFTTLLHSNIQWEPVKCVDQTEHECVLRTLLHMLIVIQSSAHHIPLPTTLSHLATPSFPPLLPSLCNV